MLAAFLLGLSLPNAFGRLMGRQLVFVRQCFVADKDTKSVVCVYSLKAIFSWGRGTLRKMAEDYCMRMEDVVYITMLCKSTQATVVV